MNINRGISGGYQGYHKIRMNIYIYISHPGYFEGYLEEFILYYIESYKGYVMVIMVIRVIIS